MIPTVFGAVFVLYAAPVTLLLAGVGLKVFRTLAGVHVLSGRESSATVIDLNGLSYVG